MADRVLPQETACHGQHVGRVELLEHGGRLARVDHEEDLVVPSCNHHYQFYHHLDLFVPPLDPHLLECVRELNVGDLLAVLELEEPVTHVPRHVDQDVRPGGRQQSLRSEIYK